MKKFLLLILTLTAFFNMAEAAPPTNDSWVVYYNDQAAPSEFSSYDPIILDADWHPDLAPLIAMEKELLGYVSLGEVGDYRYYFSDVEAAGILIAQNPNWAGSWYVDIRDPFWSQLMINTVIPNIIAQGFTGIFMDSLDIPIFLEQTNPTLYAGMIQAAVDLIIAIRNAYPNMPMMMNRGYQILNDVGGYINYALGESVYTTYNFSSSQYEYVSQAGYDWQRTLLQNAKAMHPSLIVFSLDYWDPTDIATLKQIYRTERKNGFRPYVSTILLNEIISEP